MSPLAAPGAVVTVKEVTNHAPGTWNVTVGSHGTLTTVADLLADLDAVDAVAVHLRGAGACAMGQPALLAMRLTGLHVTLHVPAHLHQMRWWAVADEIVAHVEQPLPPSDLWASDQKAGRKIRYTRCTLD